MYKIIFLITFLFFSGFTAAKDFDVLKIQSTNNIIEYKKYVTFYTNNNMPEEETEYYYYFKSYIENTKSNYNHSNAIISTNLLKSTSLIEGDIYLLQGHNYFSLNKNNEAIHSYKKALEIFKKNKDKLNTSKTHVSLSKLYFHTRFFNKSLSHLRTVINNIENIHDKILVITVYQLMGDIYSKLFLYEESRNSYLSAIDLVNKTHSLNHSFTSNIY